MDNSGRIAIVRRLAKLILLMLGKERMPSVDWLAATLDVSTRTLLRDLAALEEAGWNLPRRQNAEMWR